MKITIAKFIENLIYDKLSENFESKQILQALENKSFVMLKHHVNGFVGKTEAEKDAMSNIKQQIAKLQNFRQLETYTLDVETSFAKLDKNSIYINPINFEDEKSFMTSLKAYKKSLRPVKVEDDEIPKSKLNRRKAKEKEQETEETESESSTENL